MTLMRTLKLSAGLTALLAIPAPAETLITVPTLSDGVLTSISSISSTGGALFEQTGVSIGSSSVATMIPGTSTVGTSPSGIVDFALPGYFDAEEIWTHNTYNHSATSDVYDANGNKLYKAPWENHGLSYSDTSYINNNDNFEYVYDASGNLLNVDGTNYYWFYDKRYMSVYTEDDILQTTTTASTSAEVTLEAATVTGVESLTNMSSLVLNTLTVNTDQAIQSIDTYAAQTAFAYGSTSTASMTLPNIGEGVTTVSNTALGALNTVSINVVTPTPQ